MAIEQDAAWKAVRRFLMILTVCFLALLFAVWRVDNQRVERFRYAVIEEILPNTNSFLKPITVVHQIISDFSIYKFISAKSRS